MILTMVVAAAILGAAGAATPAADPMILRVLSLNHLNAVMVSEIYPYFASSVKTSFYKILLKFPKYLIINLIKL